jgi:hypothetical protein
VLLLLQLLCCWDDCCWEMWNVGVGTAGECCCCCYWDECNGGWSMLHLKVGLLVTCALADRTCVKNVL